ncbi:MAG: type II toxin-antitoxin system RelE/ParE family toxin [Planctomycetota bacterium]
MKPVGFHPAAMAELFEAARYYESQQPGLGRHFFAAVREATNRIQTFPLLYRALEGDIRQCRVPRFPYGLIYRPRPERIEIIAVMHLHRDPGYWKSRVQSP